MKSLSIPRNAKEAYEFVKSLAKSSKMSIAALCEDRGVSPATLTRWKTTRESYRMETLLRFMD